MGVALQRKPPKPGDQPVEHRRPLGRLRLFLDDLDDVHKLLQERTKSVSLTAGNAVADAPDDLRDATRKELDQVRFVTNDPDIVVVLTKDSASAQTFDDSAEAIRIVDDVQALLESRRSNLYFLSRLMGISLFITTGIWLFLMAIAILFPSEEEGNPVAMALLWTVPSALVLLALVTFTYREVANRARIIPERRGQARRFTAQARTAWLVGIVGVVLTAVITAIVTYAVTQ